MLTPDKMTLAMGAVRDQILAIMRDHELESHAGAPCFGNRSSCVAYLAHCLGLGGVDPSMAYTAEVLTEYDARCQGDDCPHTWEPDE